MAFSTARKSSKAQSFWVNNLGNSPHVVTVRLIVLEGDDEPVVLLRRADSNNDGKADISDALFVLSWLFLGGPVPECVAAANVNGDSGVDVSDVSYLLNHLFLGGARPVEPYPGCGPATPEDIEMRCDETPRSCS